MRRIRIIFLLCVAVLAFNSNFGAQTVYTYTVKGRVVDVDKRPVPSVDVSLRSPAFSETDLVYSVSTDQMGNFMLQRKSERPILNWTLYTSDSSSLPPNTHELLNVHMSTAFCGKRYRASCGKKVRLNANRLNDVGDISLGLRQYPLLVKLRDENNKDLVTNPRDVDGLNPWWRVRDPFGDIIGEGGNATVHFRFAESAVMVALPAGNWTLEISDDNGSELQGTFGVEVGRTTGVQEVLINLERITPGYKFDGRRVPSREDRTAARKHLKELGLTFKKSEFVQRVRVGNHKIVELYLQAGMDPNVLTTNQDVLMSALLRPKVLKLLLEAGADVNRAVERGITPLLQAVGWVVPVATIQMLLDAGADLGAKDESGSSVFASAEDKPEVLELLKLYSHRRQQ